MAEATQFALDANHASGPVLPCRAHDQGDQLLADRQTARWLRLPPPRRSACGASATTPHRVARVARGAS